MYTGPVRHFIRAVPKPIDSPYIHIYIRIQSVIKYFSRDGSLQMHAVYVYVSV